MGLIEKGEGLAELLNRGGIFRNIQGSTPREVLSALTGALKAPHLSAEILLETMLEREALMPTGIGRGVALPHPRNPLIKSESDQFAVLAFLERPVNWNSLDGEPVDTLFIIVSASAKGHLRVMSEVTFFCREEGFCRLLEERASLGDFLAYISDAEERWATGRG